MIGRKVTATAPATMANLGVGFDVLGLAFEEPFDTIHAEIMAESGVQIAEITGDGGKLSCDATKNTAGIAALHALKLLNAPFGVCLRIEKGLPLASGLGSSAASAVAAAVAVNALFDSRLDRDGLLAASLEGEAAVSGRHADNVAPALWGGIVAATGLTAADIYPLPVPNLYFALVTPNVAVPTVEARAVLPKQVPLSAMIQQTAGMALLIHALHTGDVAQIGAAMERDTIIEPARAHLMPGLHEVRRAAKACGAAGTIISGAGPTLCSVCATRQIAEAVAEAMRAVYLTLRLEAAVRVTQPSLHGAAARLMNG